MKKIFKKAISVALVVIMCLTMAPLQGFVGFDIGEWFASIANAAAGPTIESGYISGILQSYETITVIDEGYDRVTSVTVDGKRYAVSNNYKLRADYVQSCKGFKVVLYVYYGNVTSFKSREDAIEAAEKNPAVSVFADTVEFENGKPSDRKIELKTFIEHSMYSATSDYAELFAENNFLDMENISVTYTIDDINTLYFKDKQTSIVKK